MLHVISISVLDDCYLVLVFLISFLSKIENNFFKYDLQLSKSLTSILVTGCTLKYL